MRSSVIRYLISVALSASKPFAPKSSFARVYQRQDDSSAPQYKYRHGVFQICFTYEESKHGLAFREYLIRSGVCSEAEIIALEDSVGDCGPR